MGIGGCIGLIAVGAILAFAVDWDMAGVNVALVGLIMMAVGALGVAAYVSIYKRRRLGMGPGAGHVPGEPPVVEERRYYE